MNAGPPKAARIAAGLAPAWGLLMMAACGGGDGDGGGTPPPPPPPPSPSAYTLSALVSDGAVAAAQTDTHLKNPWGLALLPGGPMWVTNNADHTSTLYDGTGLVQALVVTIPGGTNGPGDVTGTVASSSTTAFMVGNGTTTAPARFIFATESGTLSAWAPTVDATNAIVVHDDGADGAVYTGLATASDAGNPFLYAADFANGRIEVFDSVFAKVTAAGSFSDPQLPAGFSPFNIQAVQVGGSTLLAVAYARESDTVPGTAVAGAGEGLLNLYSTAGALSQRLITRGGQLNAPWGITVAPAGFGTLSNALLVGNFGDGRIHGYNASTGAYLHAIGNAAGDPVTASGLWGIAFGNGARNQPANVLYLAAGINGEANGLYARIDLGATAPDIVAPTAVALTAPAPAATVSGTVAVTATATDNVGVARVVFAVRVGTTTTEIATDTTAPYGVDWNSGSVANGAATLVATAFDAFGNSAASAGAAVTVDNVPDATPPVVNITAPGAGDVSGTVAVTADATDNVGIAQVQFRAGATVIGTDTTAPYSVQWNTAGLTGAQQLTAVARDGAGNETTSAAVAVNVVVAAPAVTLASLQTAVFGPRCSGCHNGSGGGLPGSMNLSTAGASYAALVGVASTEVPSLQRVNPNDPDISYLIDKLEGTQTVGVRMPQGGPFLDQATINEVRAWIQAGAAP